MQITNLIALAILVGLTALSGAVSGALVGHVLRQHLGKETVTLEQLRIENLVVVLELKDETNEPVMRWRIDASGAEISARLVERWLADRDLVMAPKGKDFKPAPAPTHRT